MVETITLAEAQHRLPELLEATYAAHQHFVITDNGRELAVIIDAEEYREFRNWQEQRQAIQAELTAADEWEVQHPDEVQRWWYSLSYASLSRIWNHPDEDIYTAADGELL